MNSIYVTDGYYSSGTLVIPDTPHTSGAYRKFKLKNSQDEEYYLTEKNYKHFLNSPSGLGMRKSIFGARVGNRFKVSERTYDFPSVSGELLFYDDRNETKYDEYEEFIRFIQYSPLRLFYYTPGNNKTEEEANSIYMVCEIVQTTKSEISHSDSCLHIPVQFKGLSFWLNNMESSMTITTETSDNGTFTFPLTIPFTFGKDPLRDLVLPSNGTIPTPIKLTIEGSCKDPYIRFFELSSGSGIDTYKEYGACKFNGDYTYVYVDSSDDKEELSLVNGSSLIGNPAEKQDLTVGNPDDDDFFLTFLKIKPGKTYITVNLGNGFTGTVKFAWRDEYVSL